MTPSAATEITLVILGLGLLLVAGDLLVRGAVSLARALRIPSLLIGLTIVAFGTSAPELFVSVKAAMSNDPGIAVGNIIGSNIANVLMVLGIPALITPVRGNEKGVRRYASAILAATALFCWFAYSGRVLSPHTSMILLGALALFLLYVGFRAITGAPDPLASDISEFDESPKRGWVIAAFLLAGLIGLPLGASLLVENGASLAERLHVRQEVIGLTVIAVGTSLPELATTVMGAIRKHEGIVIGNILGSNMFNLLAVGGALGLSGGAAFTPYSLQLDLPVMVAATLLIAGFVYLRRDIGRLTGFLFVLAYAGYFAVLAATSATF